MPTSTLVPLSEYLRTSYHPDRDWVDGEVRERNMGEGPHANIQVFFAFLFKLNAKQWKTRVYTEQRVQTSTEHYRIADVCVVRASAPFERIVETPPLLCIEILSWDDRMSEIQERVDDYFAMGVTAVWVIDPRRRKVFSADPDGSLQAEQDLLAIADTDVRVTVREIFQELNELEGRTRG